MRIKTADLRRILQELARRGFDQRTLVNLGYALSLDWQGRTTPLSDICDAVEVTFLEGGDRATLYEVTKAL